MLKVSDLHNLTTEELVEKESQMKKQLMQLRFDAKLGKLEKQSTVKQVRRDIARVLTIMNQKRAGQVSSVGASSQTKVTGSAVGAKHPSKNKVGSAS